MVKTGDNTTLIIAVRTCRDAFGLGLKEAVDFVKGVRGGNANLIAILEGRIEQQIINGYTRAEFIHYLKDTLIPDLKEAGSVCTAQDFETAVEFMQKPSF